MNILEEPFGTAADSHSARSHHEYFRFTKNNFLTYEKCNMTIKKERGQ